MDFEPLDPKHRDQAWVTLLRCAKLVDADLIAAQLTAADIPVFIPDEYLLQAVSFNLNTYGFVRLQVPPNRYQEARQLLTSAQIDQSPDAA